MRIESGRYEGGKYLPSDERICRRYNLEIVEDEFHFVMECPVYDKLRLVLFHTVEEVDGSFHNKKSNLKEAFVYLLSSTNCEIIQALSIFVWEAFIQRESLLCR